MRPLLLIPAYDERRTVGDVVAGARCHGRVLVVDDGSTDGTGAVARDAGAEVLRHARRLGKAQALRTGIAAARARGATHVVTLDADGQHHPDDVPALLAAIAPRTIVVGSRLADASALAPERLDAIRVAGFFACWVSGLRVQDTQSGFRVYPLAVFDVVPTYRGGFVFETEILLAAAARGWLVREVPVRSLPRVASRSRFRPVADGASIGAFVARRALRRFATEAATGAAEVVALLAADRRRDRHLAMAEAAAPYGGGLAWGPAVGAAALQRLTARAVSWWRHPRLRRTAVAATATLALPVVLPLLLSQALAGRRLSSTVAALVSALYAQERFDDGAGESIGVTVDTLVTRS
ncbi:MAG TPA: glycosyltransferase family 2 protein [Methylomirabilota bacterium]|nr:glycosyltransferase family 2 protein [Methylomirabilota bacterium]